MRKLLAVCTVCTVFFMAACGNSRSNSFVTGQYYYPTQEESESAAGNAETDCTESSSTQEETLGTDAFLITENNMQEECIILEQIASGKQYMYYYSVTTQFLDKYGNRAAVSEFEPGRVITVGKKDIEGRLMQAQLSDAVWEYPDVTRYSVDEERGVFVIADTNYSYDPDVFVHSDGSRLRLSDLTQLDTLRIVGVGKKILSISVTTGHGELQLTNTEIFEGSFIQIGNKIFSEITSNMKMELPEGIYTVAVANNGYGGSTEIQIKRGTETLLDLDTLKGEGPKVGNILFAVDVAGAILQIDGKTVDYSQEVPLQYGVHTLTVTADSYDTYSKKLFVNSEKATIVIGLSGEGSATTTNTTSADDATTDANNSSTTDSATGAGNLAGSLAGSHSAGTANSGTATNATSEAELDAIVESLLEDEEDDSKTDYLSTLTELLESLTNSN